MIEVDSVVLEKKNNKWSFVKKEEADNKKIFNKVIVSFLERKVEDRVFLIEQEKLKELSLLERELGELFNNKVSVKKYRSGVRHE